VSGVESEERVVASRRPIFVHGIAPRSGTNHLLNLLCVHPDCAPPSPIWEDHLLTHVPHLDAYVEAVTGSWDPGWEGSAELGATLLEALGDGITRFLADRADAPRVVTKTPRVDNLARFGALFPRACLLILLRDGRAVVESGSRTFGWFRDAAIHDWADAARDIVDFDAAERGGALRYRVVRYEELVARPEKCLQEILGFLGLDVARYDFERAASLPVRGSSTFGRSAGDRIHWDGAERGADFDPIGRFRHWSRWQHARFNWIAGDALRELGYTPLTTPGGAAESAWNRLLDLSYPAACELRRVLRAWRRHRAQGGAGRTA
jgi:protein-tyrosine sulfotransferase